jgi:CBS domain-containing protein
MLSTDDMMRAIGYRLPVLREVSEQKLNATFSIGELMTPQPITIRPDEDLNHAVNLFSKHHIHSLPVVENGNLEGILTSHDLIDYLATQQ